MLDVSFVDDQLLQLLRDTCKLDASELLSVKIFSFPTFSSSSSGGSGGGDGGPDGAAAAGGGGEYAAQWEIIDVCAGPLANGKVVYNSATRAVRVVISASTNVSGGGKARAGGGGRRKRGSASEGLRSRRGRSLSKGRR
jgi:hypothetical protein